MQTKWWAWDPFMDFQAAKNEQNIAKQRYIKCLVVHEMLCRLLFRKLVSQNLSYPILLMLTMFCTLVSIFCVSFVYLPLVISVVFVSIYMHLFPIDKVNIRVSGFFFFYPNICFIGSFVLEVIMCRDMCWRSHSVVD